MTEVYPGIFLIKEKGSLGSIKPTVNIYLITGKNGLIFDAGFGNKRAIKHLLREIAKIQEIYQGRGKNLNFSYIMPSHCHPDHFSGLKKIREKLGTKILLTKRMASIIADERSFMKSFNADSYKDYLIIKKGFRAKFRGFIEKFFTRHLYKRFYGLSYINNPDFIINEESSLIINGKKWQIFPSHGHAVDHISIYNEKDGILLSGDNVLKSITTWLGPPNCNIGEYTKTIEHIKNLPNLKLILPAHGDIIENPKKRIKEILEHRKLRTQQVLDIIKKNSKGASPDTVINVLYPSERRMLREIARGWICLTLKMLENDGFIKRREGKREVRFQYTAKI